MTVIVNAHRLTLTAGHTGGEPFVDECLSDVDKRLGDVDGVGHGAVMTTVERRTGSVIEPTTLSSVRQTPLAQH